MNYSESAKILKEIKKAKNILVNCHDRPDGDSIGSALALRSVLRGMKKQVQLVYPSTSYDIPGGFYFLPMVDGIKKIDFKNFDYSDIDLFISLDTASWDKIAGNSNIAQPTIEFIVIDHHLSNTKYGAINLVDYDAKSTSEILFDVFTDWNIEFTKEIATSLLTGIITDTGAFKYPGIGAKTLSIAQKLMEQGASKDQIVLNLFHSHNLSLLRFWGEVLLNMKHDKEGRFVWAAIPYNTFDKLGKPWIGKETSASLFAEIVEGTEFGIIMVEEAEGRLEISFRSRTGFDTSKIALALGGGGHIYASGAKVSGLPFKKAVEKVLEVARKYAKKTS